VPPRPTDAERARLHAVFAQLCRTASPFGHEDEVAAAVRDELEAMGLDVEVDGFGNVFTRIPGPPTPSERSILLCAHLDTVPQHGPIEPVEVDEGWENAHDDILGADNKAAVAVMLLAAERAVRQPAPVGIELLFTRQEENGLNGAAAFDVSQLRSDFGYVYDHATPIGEIVMAAPSLYRLSARFHGRAAHAGIRPEDGRSAIVAAARAIVALRLGRLDAETTANVGRIEGGVGGTNVVPEYASFLAEVRSLDSDKLEALVAEMIDAIHVAANDATCDVDADVTVEKVFTGYRHGPTSPAVLAAQDALRAAGYEPRPIVSGGGSDANALEARGFHCVCLANGTERNHEPTERVSFVALEDMLAVTLALLKPE
jgi:tripeptide aminopeptidase